MARILVIDDDVAVLNSIGLLLKTEGHDAVLERESQRAVRLIKSQHYDLIITDIRMEPVDGIELLKLAHTAQAATPIIIVSAITSEETTKLGYSLGCRAYIKKPFKIKEVVDAVREALVSRSEDSSKTTGTAEPTSAAQS
jgi:two-component system, NtrC family, response regulator PilR